MSFAFLSPIKKELSDLEPQLIHYLLTPNEPTNQILSHIFSAGGKRIRPALFLLCSQLINYNGEHKYPIAAVCEYIHTASLLHDDVIDNSSLRRNKPTTNAIWGDETAVLAGDLIYSAACRFMVKTKSLDLIDSFAECIRFMSESELFQLDLLWKEFITLEQYERLIQGKTAVLFGASCQASVYLQDSSIRFSNILEDFGTRIGLAFQVADDCLDYSAQQSELGKPVTNDLCEGKITLPLIFALQTKNPSLLKMTKHILEHGNSSTDELQELVSLVVQLGGLEKALQYAENQVKYAKLALTQVKNIIGSKISIAQNEAYEALLNISDFVIERKK